MDGSVSGRVDLGMVLVVLAPICSGPADKWKKAAFDALLCLLDNERRTQIRSGDAVAC